MKYFFIILISFSSFITKAQELNCTITINSRQVEGSEKTVFEDMQRAINEFVNERKWTNDKFQIDERIECNMLITLTERVSTNSFKGKIQVQARRPIYGTNYYSPTMNVVDENFNVTFNQFEPLQFSETSYNGELPAILSYYVYMILGYDYDSFSSEGGTPYFQIAQKIVNNAQTSSANGWKAFDSQKNRYWLVENHLNGQFKPLRKLYYDYHRNGFDKLSSDRDNATATITQSLKGLLSIHQVKPSSYNMQVLFNAKKDEIINLYKKSQTANKPEIVELLNRIDPGNTNNYQKILKN